MSAPTLIDLFSGCGGFSLGMERAGFHCVAAIDFNAEAVETFRANFPEVPHVLERDLTKFPPSELAQLIGTDRVDVIAGGPPCQGFSGARKVDGANHGDRLKDDPRRLLFREYLRYVAHFQPRVFIMENVLGLQTAAGGAYFTAVQHEARLLGYRVVSQVADAFALGVPQKRRRPLIIGVRGDLPGFFPSELTPAPRAFPGTTLGPAIGDLPPLTAGEGEEDCNYDPERRRRHLARWGKVARRYLYRVLEVADAPLLTAHRARPHSARDLRDFALLHEGENSAQAMRRGVVFEWPYSKEHFKDRYTRQSRRKACSTIVAHLSKDGLMFIHPTQNRSLTPREAARVQSFPDWFWFPVARTHQFRIIGNAVPPLIAEADRRLSGSVRNPFPYVLQNALLCFGGRAYELGNLEPNQPIDLARLDVRDIQSVLQSWRVVLSANKNPLHVGQPHDPGSLETAEILRKMMFYAAAGGQDHARLENRAQSFLDLSALLKLQRAVLIAQVDPSALGKLQLTVGGAEPSGRVDRRNAFVRLVIPVGESQKSEVKSQN